jgi:hypothetical protein
LDVKQAGLALKKRESGFYFCPLWCRIGQAKQGRRGRLAPLHKDHFSNKSECKEFSTINVLTFLLLLMYSTFQKNQSKFKDSNNLGRHSSKDIKFICEISVICLPSEMFTP